VTQWSRAMVVALIALAAANCAGPAASPPRSAERSSLTLPLKDVWVVRHGWHTRVAVRQSDVGVSLWPESRDLGEVQYLEVGWGDRDYYPKQRPSIWDLIDPVIRATPAALYVGGFDDSPSEFFRETPVVQLSVRADGLDGLARFIHEHYVRDAAGKPIRIQPGSYPRSWFYFATGRYHAVAYNSNHWTATALQAAGAPTDPASALTAGMVMRQATEIAASLPRARAVGR